MTVNKTLEQNWKGYLLATAVVGGILYGVYRWGKKANPDDVPLPQDQPGGTSLSPADQTKVIDLAKRLHADMSKIIYTSSQRDDDAYKTLATLSDTLFVSVYNQFKNMYYAEGSGTLTQWINDEYFGLNLGFDMQGVISAIKNRLSQLNLN